MLQHQRKCQAAVRLAIGVTEGGMSWKEKKIKRTKRMQMREKEEKREKREKGVQWAELAVWWLLAEMQQKKELWKRMINLKRE